MKIFADECLNIMFEFIINYCESPKRGFLKEWGTKRNLLQILLYTHVKIGEV